MVVDCVYVSECRNSFPFELLLEVDTIGFYSTTVRVSEFEFGELNFTL